MSDQQFDFYASEISMLLGGGDKLLDYGAGNGELTLRFNQLGYKADAAEFSDNFKNTIECKKLNFIDATNLPLSEYDLIVANNCFFYIHPREIKKEIYRIQQALKPDGVLWITDVPTIEKVDYLTKNKLLRIIFKLTGVYQPQIGGFFFQGKKLTKEFNLEEYDSWSGYRSHFKMQKINLVTL